MLETSWRSRLKGRCSSPARPRIPRDTPPLCTARSQPAAAPPEKLQQFSARPCSNLWSLSFHASSARKRGIQLCTLEELVTRKLVLIMIGLIVSALPADAQKLQYPKTRRV